MTMIYSAGLEERAARYQREAAQASAEAMDLRIALAHMGRHPTDEEVELGRAYDAAARVASLRVLDALQSLIFVSYFEAAIAA